MNGIYVIEVADKHGKHIVSFEDKKERFEYIKSLIFELIRHGLSVSMMDDHKTIVASRDGEQIANIMPTHASGKDAIPNITNDFTGDSDTQVAAWIASN